MYNPRLVRMKKLHFVLIFVPFTEKKPQRDHDEDSGMGPSLFTDTLSTTFSEVKYHLLSLVVHVVLCGYILLSYYIQIILFYALGSAGQRAEGIGL